ncbi:NAD(P)H-dependent oxidoreductase [Streptomyces sp. NA04227]|uniref:NADPH-dependent FMN reductase n=1 Tax=Streptomyces sp. NA04227 TaxID=2742136 RepID=UPI001590099F|nr:NADPH-dependent FMN reductase [Streptomyces sp. NA04227]QKW09289.1 NAD(P)H-dependent oxidoreductase [Streptomyces sp. NA04227]
MKILALCGSLRSGSLNAAVLRSAADLFVPPWEITVEPDLSRLPFFNADVEMNDLPAVVAELRAKVGASDGLLISSPEYAHGTSGVLKNALEWLVGGGEIAEKPVALMSASPAVTGGDRARAWLTETLTVMGASVLTESLRVPMATRKVTDGRLTDEPTLAEMRELLDTLARTVAERRAENGVLAQ